MNDNLLFLIALKCIPQIGDILARRIIKTLGDPSVIFEISNEKIEKLHRARLHRPHHQDSADHLRFKIKLEEEINLFKQKYPWIEW